MSSTVLRDSAKPWWKTVFSTQKDERLINQQPCGNAQMRVLNNHFHVITWWYETSLNRHSTSDTMVWYPMNHGMKTSMVVLLSNDQWSSTQHLYVIHAQTGHDEWWCSSFKGKLQLNVKKSTYETGPSIRSRSHDKFAARIWCCTVANYHHLNLPSKDCPFSYVKVQGFAPFACSIGHCTYQMFSSPLCSHGYDPCGT